jgi:hypothetical protein
LKLNLPQALPMSRCDEIIHATIRIIGRKDLPGASIWAISHLWKINKIFGSLLSGTFAPQLRESLNN